MVHLHDWLANAKTSSFESDLAYLTPVETDDKEGADQITIGAEKQKAKYVQYLLAEYWEISNLRRLPKLFGKTNIPGLRLDEVAESKRKNAQLKEWGTCTLSLRTVLMEENMSTSVALPVLVNGEVRGFLDVCSCIFTTTWSSRWWQWWWSIWFILCCFFVVLFISNWNSNRHWYKRWN